MARDERVGMLTKTERDRIAEYTNLGPIEKKNLNFKLKKRLSEIQQSLADINHMLKQLPEEITKEYIDTDTLTQALETTENILQMLDPWPVGLHESGERRVFRSWGYTSSLAEPGKCAVVSISCSALEKDILLHDLVKEHLDRVRYFADPCSIDSVCHDQNYLDQQYLKIINERTGKPYNMEIINYKETPRIPITIPTERLRSMRWRPRSLKSCMELPPLFDEKNIPKDPTPNEKAEQK